MKLEDEDKSSKSETKPDHNVSTMETQMDKFTSEGCNRKEDASKTTTQTPIKFPNVNNNSTPT
jgi:hypothetical protein